MIDRKVIFTSRKVPNNSFTMRGEQMCAALKTLGINCEIKPPKATKSDMDSILIWVRRAPGENRLKSLSNNGNIHILDTLDRIDEIKKDRVYNRIDGILYHSKSQYKVNRDRDIKSGLFTHYLLHHFDPALKWYEHDHFELGFWGYRMAAVNVFNFVPKHNYYTSAKAGQYPPDDFFKRVSCHYHVRDEKRGLGWRPTTKISTAAACGANIIVSRDAISEELLPKDYPYFIDGCGYNETRDFIAYAKSTYGTDKWKYGLECMDYVRRATSIERCALLYKSILEKICERFPK